MKHDDYIEMMNDMEQILVNFHLPKEFVIEEGARHAVAYSVARGRTETPELWDNARIIVTKVYDTYLESVKRCGAEGCDNPLPLGRGKAFELKGGDKVVICNSCYERVGRGEKRTREPLLSDAEEGREEDEENEVDEEEPFTAAERCAGRLARQNLAEKLDREKREWSLGEQVINNKLIRDDVLKRLNPFKLSDLQSVLGLREFYKLLPGTAPEPNGME